MIPSHTKSLPPLLAALLLLAACRSTIHIHGDAAPEYVERGRWTPSHHTPDYRGVVLNLWVPARGTDDARDTIDYTFSFKNPEFGASPAVVHGHALAGAPADPAGGPYPVVIFSHGFSANAV